MGSMGMLLADWSIQLIKSRRKSGKPLKDKKRKDGKGGVCSSCEGQHAELDQHKILLQACRKKQADLKLLISQVIDLPEEETDPDLETVVSTLVQQTKDARDELSKAKQEGIHMAACINRQLTERDNAHAERVKALETLMNEKEKQLSEASNILQKQLSATKHEMERLKTRHEQYIQTGGSLEEEVQSLHIVLEMRRVEVDQLRAANNALMLELERCRAVELRLQQQTQRVEEMEAVILNKNSEIRNLYDEQERLTQQLEIEESAHLACQQELEQSQWAMDKFISTTKDLNRKESGLIMDFIHKDKSLAYSIHC